MKIYFDGCSMTHGRGYLGEDFKNIRWSKILCNQLGAEEYNISSSGSSNQRILRNLATKNFNEKYDLAVIQLTFPSRTEYYDGEKFKQINSHVVRRRDGSYNVAKKGIHGLSREVRNKNNGGSSYFWEMYFNRIYDDVYGHTIEEMVYNSVKSICKVKNIPLIMLSCFRTTKLSYDIMILPEIYEPVSDTNLHPSVSSQISIASDVYNLL
tara:strand:- start:23615 stop:24244 length:630 start_codon:yes stop_codon:yes gene_type:complete